MNRESWILKLWISKHDQPGALVAIKQRITFVDHRKEAQSFRKERKELFLVNLVPSSLKGLVRKAADCGLKNCGLWNEKLRTED